MPGLIDGHCHLSFGFPAVSSLKFPSGRGTTNPGFSTLRAARNAQTVLRSGVTSISIPGGTWFIEVGVREAIEAGLVEGPAHIHRRALHRHLRQHRRLRAVVGRDAGACSWRAGQRRERHDYRSAPPDQARRRFRQAGRQRVGRQPDNVERGDRRRGGRGPPAQRPRSHPLPGRRFDQGRSRGGRRLDYARRPGHRGRAVGRRRGRGSGDAHHDLPVRGHQHRQGEGP